MYHPYYHNPSALTEYLKQKLWLQRAKRLGRSLPAQVEQSVQLERNTYAHEPAALTEYLKHKLQVQRAKHQSHSHPAHVEQNVSLEHNNQTQCYLHGI